MEIIKYESIYRNYFKKSKNKLKPMAKHIENQVINIYPDFEKQSFIGFGGAITESSAYCYSLLSSNKKKEFMKDYFDNNYSICRICIGSSDFSLKSYSYSKKKDLSDFNISHDMTNIIPMIKDALKINPELKFLASPWSPPAFMKTNKLLNFGGHLSKIIINCMLNI